EQPGANRPVKLLGTPVRLTRTPAAPTRAPGPALGQDTDEILARAGYSDQDIAALHECGAVAGASTVTKGSFLAG
ncbi:MAG TPA: hypothetical protein VE983_05805, partial [Solirubrobacteraceae bacterium]|nr:hypothetical protein [Solirubrobacteraceae bacterium]